MTFLLELKFLGCSWHCPHPCSIILPSGAVQSGCSPFAELGEPEPENVCRKGSTHLTSCLQNSTPPHTSREALKVWGQCTCKKMVPPNLAQPPAPAPQPGSVCLEIKEPGRFCKPLSWKTTWGIHASIHFLGRGSQLSAKSKRSQ